MKYPSTYRLLAVKAVILSIFILSFAPAPSADAVLSKDIGFRWQPSYPVYTSPYMQVSPDDSPAFQSFVKSVADGRRDSIRGIFVEGVLALPVIEQPVEKPAFVSENPETGTLFSKAVENGITGVLAHNYLAGERFYALEAGQEVRVVFGDGRYRPYRVTGRELFQRLKPNDLRSELVDLKSGKRLSSGEVFNRFYKGDHRITFQTCLARNGLSNWGLSFTVAEPIHP